MLKRVLMLTAVTLLLSACAKPTTGCLEVSCRPSSDLHRLTIWWQPEMRNGPYDYTQVPVDH